MKVGHQMANMCGGRLMQPNLRQDKDKIYYHHRRGFEDCFEHPQNIPFRSCL